MCSRALFLQKEAIFSEKVEEASGTETSVAKFLPLAMSMMQRYRQDESNCRPRLCRKMNEGDDNNLKEECVRAEKRKLKKESTYNIIDKYLFMYLDILHTISAT